jgi:hypothetical protein
LNPIMRLKQEGLYLLLTSVSVFFLLHDDLLLLPEFSFQNHI